MARVYPVGEAVTQNGLWRHGAGHLHVVTDRTETPLRMSCPARATELRAMRQVVDRWARGSGLSDDAVVDLQLALGEAVANGIEHAYPAEEPGRVEIELVLHDRTGVRVRVVDHGRWRPVPARPGDRGRGLQMIEQIAGHVHVRADDSGTEICFEVPIAAA
jgi:anti-sigma regulatory factor (Ser/Thr protein kinase)